MNKIQALLFENQDKEYRAFQAKLMPTVPYENIIGVRTPVVRAMAKELFKNGGYSSFLKELPHKYYDENNLHAYIIEQIKDFDTAIYELERFLPYVDNWATCDTFLPKCFKRNKRALLVHIYSFLQSGHTYTVRYGIGLLMKLYLGADFKTEYAEAICAVRSDEYYVQMMAAWYFQVALVKNYEEVLPFFTNKLLSREVLRKAVQKAAESRRISPERVAFLKSLL